MLVGVLDAKDVLSMDRNGLSDPYVSIVPIGHDGKEITDEKRVTRTIPDTLNPEWDQTFSLG